MSYQTLDNILIDTATYEAFEALARSRCMPPQVLARELITEAVFHRPPKPRGIALVDGLPRRARRHAEPEDDLDELVVPPDPDDEPASTRLLRRVRSQPL
jgi:hypothetical protein